MSKPSKSAPAEQLSFEERMLSPEARELLRLGKIEQSRRQKRRRANDRRRALGLAVTGTPVYGKRAREDGRLEDHPDEQKVIELMVKMRRAGETIAAIVNACNAKGYRSRLDQPIAKRLVTEVCKRELPELKFPRGRRKKSQPPKRAA